MMPGIVIRKNKAVYWPIPKNACTAIKLHLCNYIGIPAGENPHDAPFEWTDGVIDGFDNFAIVRNPYIRLFSLWKNKCIIDESLDMNVFSRWADIFYHGMSFHDFVMGIVTIPVMESDPHFSPQCMQMPADCETVRLMDIKAFMRGILPIANDSGDDDWREHYTPELKKIVSNHYREDFIRFGYV